MSHDRIVCNACVVLNVHSLIVLDSRHSRHPETQTRTTATIPHSSRELWPKITQKTMWRWRKDESIDCLGQLTHEQCLEGKHIFLAVVQKHNLIRQCFRPPPQGSTIVDIVKDIMISQQIQTLGNSSVIRVAPLNNSQLASTRCI